MSLVGARRLLGPIFFLFSGAGAAAFFLGTFQNPKIAGPVQGLR